MMFYCYHCRKLFKPDKVYSEGLRCDVNEWVCVKCESTNIETDKFKVAVIERLDATLEILNVKPRKKE